MLSRRVSVLWLQVCWLSVCIMQLMLFHRSNPCWLFNLWGQWRADPGVRETHWINDVVSTRRCDVSNITSCNVHRIIALRLTADIMQLIKKKKGVSHLRYLHHCLPLTSGWLSVSRLRCLLPFSVMRGRKILQYCTMSGSRHEGLNTRIRPTRVCEPRL